MKTIIPLFVLILFISCSINEQGAVTNRNDYNQYLTAEPVELTSKYYRLWNDKIKPDSLQLTSFSVVGSEYTRYFNQTGDISYLKKAEQSYTRAAKIAAIGKSGHYRSLARNYISQHRFKEALQWAEKAYELGSGLQASQALLFDVHMELGNYTKAKTYLNSIRNELSFDYLIRAAKWNDHKGNLTNAIRFMEKAKTKVENASNDALKIWTYTNLADFYGHAGRIREAYQHYLKALAMDGANAYAKKGIAWIVFSYENNPEEALRILNQVTEVNQTPDYQLLKAEIASYMKDDIEKTSFLDAYYKEVRNSAYGGMYNVHTVKFYLNETQQYQKALALAKQEVNNRATPETYDLLAYAYFKNGELKKALDIVNDFVVDKTFEPEALLHMAEIYNANGAQEKVQDLKEELEDAAFEMGPSFPQRLASL